VDGELGPTISGRVVPVRPPESLEPVWGADTRRTELLDEAEAATRSFSPTPGPRGSEPAG